MGEKTLLVELKKEEKKIVEKKLEEARELEAKVKEKQQPKQSSPKYSNVFSSKSFKSSSNETILAPKLDEIRKNQVDQQKKQEEEKILQLENKVSAVIETPNYDQIETLSEKERQKVFKIKREEKAQSKTKPSRIKSIVFALLFAIFGVWGIVNIAQIDSIGSQIAQVSNEYYNINLPKFLKNLVSLDATNSENMENLFETIPDEDVSPSEIEEKSNWFDRFCNFIAGLFGG